MSRFNILFEGESEDGLSELRNAALEHQRRLQQQLQYNAARDSVPLSAAPMLTDDTLEGIVRRLGMDYWDVLPPLPQQGQDGEELGAPASPAAGAGRNAVAAAQRVAAAAAAAGGRSVPSAWYDELGEDSDDFMGADGAEPTGSGGEDGGDDGGAWDAASRAPSHRTGVTHRTSRTAKTNYTARTARTAATGAGGSGDGAADSAAAAAEARAARAAARRAGAGSKRLAAGPPGGYAQPALRRRLLAWRYTQRAWRKSTTDEPVERIRSHLEEARVQYAVVSAAVSL